MASERDIATRAMKRIGLIGLGSIGSRFAEWLRAADYPLVVRDLDPAKVAAAVERGAVAADSPAEVARASDVVLLSLPGSHAVEAVMLGEQGVLEALRPGQVVIDTGTSRPASHLQLVELVEGRGGRMLDAPVTWRRAGLTVMVGGDRATYEECRGILETIGAKVRYVGGPGQGLAMKLVNQMIQAATTAGVAESLVFAARAGLDLDQTVETLDVAGGAAAMVARRFAGAGQLRLHLKDLDYALEVARDLAAPMPLTALVHEVFKAVDRAGDPSWTQPAIVTYWEALAGVEVRGDEG